MTAMSAMRTWGFPVSEMVQSKGSWVTKQTCAAQMRVCSFAPHVPWVPAFAKRSRAKVHWSGGSVQSWVLWATLSMMLL